MLGFVAVRTLVISTGLVSGCKTVPGVMHAIGQLVIHAAMPGQAMQVDKIAPPLDARRLDAERVSLGYDYAQVGAELARRWKFPPAFTDAIAAWRPAIHAAWRAMPADFRK